MYRGVNSLTLDAKGRMAMPTRYREQLLTHCGGQMVITVERDHCLLLYPLPEWETIERKLAKLPTLNKQARRLQRLLVGHATECELDGNGRILIPPPLRAFASLDRRVTLLGQTNKFELWDEPTWNERRDEWLNEVDADDLELPTEMETLSY